MKRLDLTGLVTEGHTVVSFAGMNEHKKSTWNCVCNHCGSEFVTHATQAQTGAPCKACSYKRAGLVHRTHGLSVVGRRSAYRVWKGIKQRCNNPNNPAWHNYGGRGIRMHEPWVTDAGAFVEYVTSLPHYGEEGRTLDRINNDGNYEPGNLRWATKFEQATNTRLNRYITHNGDTRTLAEWAKLAGVSYQTLHTRVIHGKPILKEGDMK